MTINSNSIDSLASIFGGQVKKYILCDEVKSIGEGAFSGSYSLTSVFSLIEKPFVVACFTPSTFQNVTLYVPAGTIEEYRATEGWKDFLYIVEGAPAAVEEVRAENGQTERYRLDGRRVDKMQRGINIVRDKNGATRKVLRK